MFNRNKLQAQMVLKGMNGKEMAKKLDITEGTFYRKMGNDGDFSREEIQKISDVLDIEDNLADIFFAKELS
jgi:hypothetical protein